MHVVIFYLHNLTNVNTWILKILYSFLCVFFEFLEYPLSTKFSRIFKRHSKFDMHAQEIFFCRCMSLSMTDLLLQFLTSLTNRNSESRYIIFTPFQRIIISYIIVFGSKTSRYIRLSVGRLVCLL